MGFLSVFRRTEVEAVEVDDGAPRFGGTFIVAMGPPRSGKTHSVVRLACRASLHYGLPLIAQDVTGNVKARIQGFRAAAIEAARMARSKAEREDAESEVEFFSSEKKHRLYPGKDVGPMLEDIERLVGDGSVSSNRWQAVILFDEGAIIRAQNPEFFNAVAPMFGNAGLLGYVTEQREVGVPPSLRACVRRYLVWKGGGGKQTINDIDYPNDILTDRASDTITVIDPTESDPSKAVSHWNVKSEPPLELITPAALSVPIKERV